MRSQLTFCAMRPTTDEEPGQGDRRVVERQATTQLTTLTSLLAGFGFLWFTSLVDKELLHAHGVVFLPLRTRTGGGDRGRVRPAQG